MSVAVLARIGYQSNWVDVLSAGFMRNAFLGGLLVALAAGLLGYFVIVRQHAFAAHALAHIGFPGATGAILVGVPVLLILIAGNPLPTSAQWQAIFSLTPDYGYVILTTKVLPLLCWPPLRPSSCRRRRHGRRGRRRLCRQKSEREWYLHPRARCSPRS